MKKTFILIVMGICLSLCSYAQQTESLNIENFDIPNAPAFTLLDQTPSVIECPSSSKALVLSILQSFQNSNGFPQNYAVEFTPFWFFKHPNLTAYQYAGYNPDKQKQMPFNRIQRASISMAYISSQDTGTHQFMSHLSLGIRFNILTIKSKKDIHDLQQANDSLISYLKKKEERCELYMDQYYPNLIYNNRELYKIKIKEFYDTYENSAGIKDSLQYIIAKKPMFSIDGAIGGNGFFINHNIKDSHFGRIGAWITISYSCPLKKELNNKNYINLYLIGRYLSDGTQKNAEKYFFQHYFDFGGKAELELSRFSIAFEYLYRLNDIEQTFRANGILKYQVADNLYLTCSFGKNFGEINNLIALFGLNFGFSSGFEKLNSFN